MAALVAREQVAQAAEQRQVVRLAVVEELLERAVLALGLHIAGHKDVSLYDGSWAEWGDPEADLPVATGPAD